MKIMTILIIINPSYLCIVWPDCRVPAVHCAPPSPPCSSCTGSVIYPPGVSLFSATRYGTSTAVAVVVAGVVVVTGGISALLARV